MALQFGDMTPGTMKYIHSIINRLKLAKGLYPNKLEMKDEINDIVEMLRTLELVPMCCVSLCESYFGHVHVMSQSCSDQSSTLVFWLSFIHQLIIAYSSLN